MNKCENCGAPLNKYGGCDYCGTGKQTPKQEIISMYDSVKILLSAGLSPEDAQKYAGLLLQDEIT